MSKSKVELVKENIKNANFSLEQHQKLHRLLRDYIIDKTMVSCREIYNEEALKRGVEPLSLEV